VSRGCDQIHIISAANLHITILIFVFVNDCFFFFLFTVGKLLQVSGKTSGLLHGQPVGFVFHSRLGRVERSPVQGTNGQTDFNL